MEEEEEEGDDDDVKEEVEEEEEEDDEEEKDEAEDNMIVLIGWLNKENVRGERDKQRKSSDERCEQRGFNEAMPFSVICAHQPILSTWRRGRPNWKDWMSKKKVCLRRRETELKLELKLSSSEEESVDDGDEKEEGEEEKEEEEEDWEEGKVEEGEGEEEVDDDEDDDCSIEQEQAIREEDIFIGRSTLCAGKSTEISEREASNSAMFK